MMQLHSYQALLFTEREYFMFSTWPGRLLPALRVYSKNNDDLTEIARFIHHEGSLYAPRNEETVLPRRGKRKAFASHCS